MNHNKSTKNEDTQPSSIKVKLDPETKKKLRFLASRTYRNQSQVIRWLINEAVKHFDSHFYRDDVVDMVVTKDEKTLT